MLCALGWLRTLASSHVCQHGGLQLSDSLQISTPLPLWFFSTRGEWWWDSFQFVGGSLKPRGTWGVSSSPKCRNIFHHCSEPTLRKAGGMLSERTLRTNGIDLRVQKPHSPWHCGHVLESVANLISCFCSGQAHTPFPHLTSRTVTWMCKKQLVHCTPKTFLCIGKTEAIHRFQNLVRNEQVIHSFAISG